MNDILLFILKSGMAMAVFYLIYKVFMQNETCFSVNRFYLLGTVLLSLLISGLQFENLFIIREKLITPAYFINLDQTEINPSVSMNNLQDVKISLVSVLGWIYIGGVCIFCGGLLFEFIRFMMLRHRDEQNYGPMRVIFIDREIRPFSLFNLIFMNTSMRFDPNLNTILQHEYAHYRKLHFIDLLFLEVIKIFHWFNPFIWLYVRAIKEIHEYQADTVVLNNGKDSGKYQALLVNQLTGTEIFRLTNFFNGSLTKKRMIMMTKMKSKKSVWLKTLVALPALIILLLIYASNSGNMTPQNGSFVVKGKVIDADSELPIQGVNIVITETQSGTITYPDGSYEIHHVEADSKLAFSYVGYETVVTPVTSKRMDIKLKRTSYSFNPYELEPRASRGEEFNLGSNVDKRKFDENGAEVVFFIVEDLAHFPGGNKALKEYLVKNIRYPGDVTKGTSQVLVEFMIDTDGSVKDVVVKKGTSEAMNKEAARLVKAMPDWKPAQQRGMNVKSKYIIPVLFEKQF